VSTPNGEHATWHVESYVRKLWLLRQTNPIGFGFAIRAVNFAIRAVNKLKRTAFLSGALTG
jgi:hypothetical protein